MWSSLYQFCQWLRLHVEAEGALCRAVDRLQALNTQANAGDLSGYEWVRLQRHLQELEQFFSLQNELQTLQERVEEAASKNDPNLGDALCERLAQLQGRLAPIEESLLLQEPHDDSSALLLIYDAQDDASMIFDDPPASPGALWVDQVEQMYTRWSRAKNGGVRQLTGRGQIRFTIDGRSFSPTIIAISAERAYGKLRSEAGLHRLQGEGSPCAVVEVYPNLPAASAADWVRGYSRLRRYNGRNIQTMPLIGEGGQRITIEYNIIGRWAWYGAEPSTQEEIAARVLRGLLLRESRRNDSLRRSYLKGPAPSVRDHYTASSLDCFYEVLEKGALDPLLLAALRRPLSMLRCQKNFPY